MRDLFFLLCIFTLCYGCQWTCRAARWDSPSCWDCARIPTGTDSVLINSPAQIVVPADLVISIVDLTMKGNASLTVHKNVTFFIASLRVGTMANIHFASNASDSAITGRTADAWVSVWGHMDGLPSLTNVTLRIIKGAQITIPEAFIRAAAGVQILNQGVIKMAAPRGVYQRKGAFDGLLVNMPTGQFIVAGPTQMYTNGKGYIENQGDLRIQANDAGWQVPTGIILSLYIEAGVLFQPSSLIMYPASTLSFADETSALELSTGASQWDNSFVTGLGSIRVGMLHTMYVTGSVWMQWTSLEIRGTVSTYRSTIKNGTTDGVVLQCASLVMVGATATHNGSDENRLKLSAVKTATLDSITVDAGLSLTVTAFLGFIPNLVRIRNDSELVLAGGRFNFENQARFEGSSSIDARMAVLILAVDSVDFDSLDLLLGPVHFFASASGSAQPQLLTKGDAYLGSAEFTAEMYQLPAPNSTFLLAQNLFDVPKIRFVGVGPYANCLQYDTAVITGTPSRLDLRVSMPTWPGLPQLTATPSLDMSTTTIQWSPPSSVCVAPASVSVFALGKEYVVLNGSSITISGFTTCQNHTVNVTASYRWQTIYNMTSSIKWGQVSGTPKSPSSWRSQYYASDGYVVFEWSPTDCPCPQLNPYMSYMVMTPDNITLMTDNEVDLPTPDDRSPITIVVSGVCTYNKMAGMALMSPAMSTTAYWDTPHDIEFRKKLAVYVFAPSMLVVLVATCVVYFIKRQKSTNDRYRLLQTFHPDDDDE